MIYVYIWHWIGGKNCRKSLYLMGNSHGFRLRFSRKPNQWIYGSWSMEVDLKVKYNYINYIYTWTSHWYTKMCTIFFLPNFKKCARLRVWKKKGVRSSVALHSNQPDSFPKGSIGHFCHALVHVQHAKYDLEQLRLTTWVASQHM